MYKKAKNRCRRYHPWRKEKNMFLHVTGVTYLESYKLRIEFNDGVIKDVDLKDELYGEIFEPLKNTKLFKQVRVNLETNTIEWPNGADFAPEFLYKIGKKVKKKSETHRETIDWWLGEKEKQMAKDSSEKRKWRS